MRLIMIAAVMFSAAALAACGGGGSGKVKIKPRSAAEIGKICKAREEDVYVAFKDWGMASDAKRKSTSEIQRQCCPKMVKYANKLTKKERAYLFNEIGAEMDGGTLTPRELQAYRDAEDAIRADMTTAEVSRALDAEQLEFMKCKYNIMHKYEG